MGWSDDLKKIIERDKLDAEKFLKTAVIQAANVAIVRSPVGNDTLWKNPAPPGYVGGSYRSNHRITINSVSYDIKQIADASKTLNDIASGAASIKLGDVIYVTNPLPYAARIEYDSWSSQAPDGVYRPSVIALKKALNKEANK